MSDKLDELEFRQNDPLGCWVPGSELQADATKDELLALIAVARAAEGLRYMTVSLSWIAREELWNMHPREIEAVQKAVAKFDEALAALDAPRETR